MKEQNLKSVIHLLPLLFAFSLPLSSFAASIIIVNKDGFNEGLNDPTAVSPIDGNAGVTLGEQRMNVLQFAANFIETIIEADVEIKIDARFDPDEPYILGSAAPMDWEYETFSNRLPYSSTWYPQALVNHFYGYDKKTSASDITVNFNSSITSNYYGFNSTPTYSWQSHLLSTVLHEIIHGLGFLETSIPSTGDFNPAYPDIFTQFLEEHTLSLTWPNMTSAQRFFSLRNDNLHWVGDITRAESEWLQSRLPSNAINRHWANGHVSLFAPSSYNSGSSGSHFDEFLKPDEIMEHAESPEDPKNHIGLAKQVLQDMGWPVFSNGDKPLLSAISNANILNTTTYQTSFAVYDNDNAYHRNQAYDWSGSGGSPFLVMGMSATSSNQSVISNNNISISGVTNNISNSANTLRQLTLTPEAGSSGQTMITVNVWDVDGNTDEKSFLLTVEAPNTPPVISITNPVDGEAFLTNAQSFSAQASDVEDGVLTNITWSYLVAGGASYIRTADGPTWNATLEDGNYNIGACILDSRDLSSCDVIAVVVSAFGDFDGDGINNSTEVSQLTDPYNNDTDNDGLLDGVDAQPTLFTDGDGDTVGDGFDNCFATANVDQANLDGDALGDVCDPDIDGDGFSNNIEDKFGTNKNDGADLALVYEAIDAYSSQAEPEKNVPMMGFYGLFTLGLSIFGLGFLRLKR